MVTLDWTASAHDGVTLVTVYLRDIDVPTEVTVESRLDGPVWPPRREGVPEAGWSDDGFAGVVGPGTTVLGYATPAPPAEPPVALVDAEPVPEADAREELTTAPESVVRQLGDPSPPADAVPTGAQRPPDGGSTPRTGTEPGEGGGESVERVSPTDRGVESTATPDGPADLPAAVGPWLAEMARRTDRAERLAEAETVPEATAAVRSAGGMAGVRDLAESDDTRRLRTLARRARRLADRRESATVPVDTLAALA